MKPKHTDNHPDLFQLQLSQIINMSHPLVKLAHQINWDRIATQIDTVYTTGPGHPPLPTRLLAGLHYLKHAFDESDESVLVRWLENPYWQYFCGYSFLQHQLPYTPPHWSNGAGG
ncbi:transposase [Paralysiella testudinis]|uniref:Transposase n=1 Tax=Paralysiella testudinis TaxID=2809020 RepID=A0A892ZE81_9NEIS|nr:transposase [Paralysiella testudinis]QRQ80930.1 transposase [Paralysiella testudinis]